MQKIRLAFFGTPKFSATILNILISQCPNILVSSVVTQPDKPIGRKQSLTPSPVKIQALEHKIPVYDWTNSTFIHDRMNVVRPDLVIVAAFGKILPKEILKIPKFGCLGVHPSLLPKYRGPTPVQFAILNGEKETGVTIFLMDEKMDQGKIIANCKLKIENLKITTEELTKELAKLGAKLLIETVPKWVKGEIKPKSQNHKKATYTKLLTKKDGFVKWKRVVSAMQKKVQPSLESREIDRMIRALTPWPGVWTNIKILRYKDIKILRLKILKAHLEMGRLVLEQVQLEGKNPVSWKEFIQGYPTVAFL